MRLLSTSVFNCQSSLRRILLFAKTTSALCSNVSFRHNHEFLTPFVDPKYSYAFGRSNLQPSYRTFSAFLEDRVQSKSNSLAVISHHEQLQVDNKTFYTDVHSLAYGIYHELGIRRGDVVCIWSCNSYKWLQIQYACSMIGAIICTVNPGYQGPELLYAIQKAKAKAIFMPGAKSSQNHLNPFFKILSHPKVLNELKAKSELRNVIFMDEHDGSLIENIKQYTVDQLCSNDKLNAEILEQVQVDDPALIMYTSGTTGKPKGAVLSHFTLINNAILSGNRMVTDFTKIICMPLPLFHAFAYVAGSVMMCVTDGVLVMTGHRYINKDVVDSINQYKCNLMFGTPTMIIDMMNYVRQNNIKIDSLKHLTSGGASMPIETAHQISSVLPSVDDFRIGYGATETGPVATCLLKTDPFEKRMETVGRPIDFIELKVVNPETQRIELIGQKGELLVRGHNLMIGYLDEDEKTKEAITPARWYRTGDIATMDSEGFIRICGRTKEMIIRGGENVYPLEVEQVLHTHPNVLEGYVIGIPDKRVGEEIYAWVKIKDPNVATSEEDIREFLRDKLTYFKIPKHILFVNDFPLTPAGKAKKFLMVEETCRSLGISMK